MSGPGGGRRGRHPPGGWCLPVGAGHGGRDRAIARDLNTRGVTTRPVAPGTLGPSAGSCSDRATRACRSTGARSSARPPGRPSWTPTPGGASPPCCPTRPGAATPGGRPPAPDPGPARRGPDRPPPHRRPGRPAGRAGPPGRPGSDRHLPTGRGDRGHPPQQRSDITAQLAAMSRGSVPAGVADAARVWQGLDLSPRRAIIDTLATVTILPARRGRRPGRPALFDPTSVSSFFDTQRSRIEHRPSSPGCGSHRSARAGSGCFTATDSHLHPSYSVSKNRERWSSVLGSVTRVVTISGRSPS